MQPAVRTPCAPGGSSEQMGGQVRPAPHQGPPFLVSAPRPPWLRRQGTHLGVPGSHSGRAPGDLAWPRYLLSAGSPTGGAGPAQGPGCGGSTSWVLPSMAQSPQRAETAELGCKGALHPCRPPPPLRTNLIWRKTESIETKFPSLCTDPARPGSPGGRGCCCRGGGGGGRAWCCRVRDQPGHSA